MILFFLLFSSLFHLTPTITPAEIKSRRDSTSSLNGSSTANQVAASTSPVSGPMEIDFLWEVKVCCRWTGLTFWCGSSHNRSFFMLILTGPIVEGTAKGSQHVNNWTIPPFPPPHHMSGIALHAHHKSEPTLFDLATLPSSQHQDTTLILPSDSATSLLHDVDYYARTEFGTTSTTFWDGYETDNSALDTFEKTFGSYIYPQ